LKAQAKKSGGRATGSSRGSEAHHSWASAFQEANE
jgi:hypothetical protein